MKEKIFFEVKHLFKPSYFTTFDKLEAAYKPMFDWLDEHCPNRYSTTAMDNSAFSDWNEDPWIEYYIDFNNKEDAMAFKLRWM